MQKQSTPADSQFDLDFKWLMASERGRRLVFHLLEKSGVFRASIGRGMVPDIALDMAYAEGQKSLGLAVMKKIEVICFERFSQMMKEQQNGRPSTGRTDTGK